MVSGKGVAVEVARQMVEKYALLIPEGALQKALLMATPEPLAEGGWILRPFRRNQCGGVPADCRAPRFLPDPNVPEALAGAILEIGRFVRSVENTHLCQWDPLQSGVGEELREQGSKLLRYAAVYALYRNAPFLYNALLRQARDWFRLACEEKAGHFNALIHLPLCRLHPKGPAAYGCLFQQRVVEILQAFAEERNPSNFMFRSHAVSLYLEERV